MSYFVLLYLKKIRDTREKYTKLRTIYINNIKPNNYDGEEPLDYADNRMITSRVKLFYYMFENLC
jgi:hypothetical protein